MNKNVFLTCWSRCALLVIFTMVWCVSLSLVASYLGPRYIALSHSLSLLETTNVKMSGVKLSTLQSLLLSKVRG